MQKVYSNLALRSEWKMFVRSWFHERESRALCKIAGGGLTHLTHLYLPPSLN